MLETEILTQEVRKLLNKGVIEECSKEKGDFVPGIRKMELSELF